MNLGHHDLVQVQCSPMGIDGPAVAMLDQQWQAARMVDVRMRDDHGVGVLRVEPEVVMVVALVLADALDQAP